MKGMREFLRRAMKNENGVYDKERYLIMENRVFIVMLLAQCVLLITPWGRWIIKWIAYIMTGFVILASMAAVYNNYQALKKSYKYSKKLEKMGMSYEDEERARRWLCEQEGDDGFEAKFPFGRKVVYFVDHSAWNHFADALYGCYLAQTFQPKYLKLPENAVVYTTRQELEKLHKMEAAAVDKTAPYLGYTSFIRANCKVVEAHAPTDAESLITTILMLQKKENVSAVLISTDDELKEYAAKHNVFVINPKAD